MKPHKLRDLLRVDPVAKSTLPCILFVAKPMESSHRCIEPAYHQTVFSLWLPKSILDLTVTELAAYMTLGVVVTDDHTLVSNTLPAFLAYLEECKSNHL